MSTYYFMVCDDCKERTPAASKIAGNEYCYLIDSDETLPPFIIFHADHNVRIVNEHHDDAYGDGFIDWTAENVDEMWERKWPR